MLKGARLMGGILARDPRVAAILTSPDDYFDRARARAWVAAGRDVVTDLSRREARRRNGLGFFHLWAARS